jgi:hypothetical protein
MKKVTTIDDKIALRAFVMPDLFPFLLEIYLKEGKTELALLEDIKKARECYKTLVSSAKQK